MVCRQCTERIERIALYHSIHYYPGPRMSEALRTRHGDVESQTCPLLEGRHGGAIVHASIERIERVHAHVQGPGFHGFTLAYHAVQVRTRVSHFSLEDVAKINTP
jgi:hypothetical protein